MKTKTTYFLVKVTDTGIESSVEGIEKATQEMLDQLEIPTRPFINADTLKIYLSSSSIPLGCDTEITFLCES